MMKKREAVLKQQKKGDRLSLRAPARPARGGLEGEEEESHPQGRSGLGPRQKAQKSAKTAGP